MTSCWICRPELPLQIISYPNSSWFWFNSTCSYIGKMLCFEKMCLCVIVCQHMCIYNNFKYHVSCTDGNISIRIILIAYLFHRHPTHKLCFLSWRPFVVNTTFLTGLVVPSVSWLGTEGTTSPVENVVLTTKGLQERKQNLWEVEKIGN